MRPYLTAFVSALVLAQASIQTPCALAGQADEVNTKSKEKASIVEQIAGPTITLDKIVVSATRTEKSVKEVPASVVLVEEEQILQSQATSVKDILDMIPNTSFSDATNPLLQKPSLRGLGANQTIMIIDGVRQNYSSSAGNSISPALVDPDMLKQVEVARGPSSVMHGSGGIGGVISMTTKDAADFLDDGDNFGGQIKLGYQSANSQLMESTALYGRYGMVDIVVQQTYRDLGNGNTTSSDPSDSTYQYDGNNGSGMLKLSVLPTDSQRITLNYNYYDGRSGSSYDVDEHRLVASYSLAPEDSQWIDFKANVQGAWRDNSFVNDYVNSDDEFSSYGISMQNTSRFAFGDSVNNSLTYGLDYYRDQQSSINKDTGQPDPMRPDATATDLGLFVQDEIEIMDFLTITPALRYTSYNRSSDDHLAEDQNDSALTPKISALAKVTPWLNVFGSYGESYRAPSMDEIYFAMDYAPYPLMVLPNPNLKPEKAKTWEAGFSLDFDNVFTHNDPLFIKFVYFTETVKDFISVTQLPPVGGVDLTTNTNIGEVKRYGFEAEAAYQYDDLSLALSYGKVIGRDAETDELSGGSPETVNFRAGYFFSDLDLTVFWKSKFVSEYKNVQPWGEVDKYDAYDIHGIGLSWEPSQEAWEGFRVDAGIDNLFDKRYVNQYGYEEVGQNYKLTFSYSF